MFIVEIKFLNQVYLSDVLTSNPVTSGWIFQVNHTLNESTGRL